MKRLNQKTLKERLREIHGFSIEYDHERPPKEVKVYNDQGEIVGRYEVGYIVQKGKKMFAPDFDSQIK